MEGEFSRHCGGRELVFLDSLCPAEDFKGVLTLSSSVCLELLSLLLDVVEVLVSVHKCGSSWLSACENCRSTCLNEKVELLAPGVGISGDVCGVDLGVERGIVDGVDDVDDGPSFSLGLFSLQPSSRLLQFPISFFVPSLHQPNGSYFVCRQ